MYKRMTIRIVDELAENISDVAKKRGISINALVSEMAWQFVSDWEERKIKSNEKEDKK